MKNIIKELTKEYNKRIEDNIKRFKEELNSDENKGITYIERNVLKRKKPYVNSRISQVEARLKAIYTKQLNEKIERLKEVNEASDKLPNDLTLIINFYKSSAWGYCPKGSDNYGNATSSITGCGYCKESTATAQLLNQNDIIMKKLLKAKNKKATSENSDLLGYGSGYGILPNFEGGVGVSCHVSILESLGYKVTLSGNNSTTVLTISDR